MTYQGFMGGGLDYHPCRYGASKLSFRGPERELDGDFIAFLGSTETYGKFIRTPFPDLVGQTLGVRSVNLGCLNAGVDTYSEDAAVQEICRQAAQCVVQVMGAHRLSNPLYRVHGRRNDRFLAPSERLRTLYPEVDFSEIHFARHLIATLAGRGDERFDLVRRELKAAWVARMTRLIEACAGPVVLLWLAERTPDQGSDDPEGLEPLFVDRGMLDAFGPGRARLVEVPLEAVGGDAATEGMVFSELERGAALRLPGPAIHRRVAASLVRSLARTL